MRLRAIVRGLRLDLTALVWPTECAGCGAPDRDCCDRCIAELWAAPRVIETNLGVPCFVASRYGGVLAALLVTFKHAGRIGFAGVLGDRLRPPLLAALERCSGRSPPVIVTVPSRPRRVRERGYRHVELLLRRALRATGERSSGGRFRSPIAVLRVRALRTLRGRRGQVGLGPAERIANARLVAVRQPSRRLLHGREVVLVDDVITTGATVLAARAELEAHGATVVAIVALGIAERRDTRRN